MLIDFLVQAIAILMGALGFVIALYSPTTRRVKIGWCFGFVALCIVEVGLVRRQSNEAEIERVSSEEHRGLTEELRDEIDALEDLNRDLQSQILVLQNLNHNLDSQIMAIRRQFGISATLDEGISVGTKAGLGAEATGDEEPGHAAPENRGEEKGQAETRAPL